MRREGTGWRSFSRWTGTATMFSLAMVLSALWSPSAGAREPSARPETSEESESVRQEAVLTGQGRRYDAGEYVGPATCASGNCHGAAEATDAYDVLQSEFTIWFHRDPHRTAWDVLHGDESRLIARNLDLEAPAHRAPVCLECHATVVPRARQANRLEREDGISCETCHGPAGGWLARHTDDSFAYEDGLEAGMTDLRDLEVRAELCLGCHLGTSDRQVDHELIASGHPELVFELDNYTEAMPPHWVPHSRLRDPGDRRQTHGLVAWAVGQVEGFREGLELLSARAGAGRWPEFADMSCDSCHHDLRNGEWRQVRGYRYRPGTPPWSPARWVVLRHLIDRVAPDVRETLDDDVEKVARTVAEIWSPPADVMSAADAAARRLSGLIPVMERARWTEGDAREILRSITSDRETVMRTDRQAAEQIALAAQSLVSHLDRRAPAGARSPLIRAVDGLFAQLEDPYAYDRTAFAAALERLGDRL